MVHVLSCPKNITLMLFFLPIPLLYISGQCLNHSNSIGLLTFLELQYAGLLYCEVRHKITIVVTRHCIRTVLQSRTQFVVHFSGVSS